MSGGGARAPRAVLGARVEAGATRFTAFSSAVKTCFLRVWRGAEKLPTTHEMEPLGSGHFECRLPGAGHGTLYCFVLDGRELPDPYARFLPEGVHGRAMVVESRFRWRAPAVSRPLREHVLYELHIGTFTEQGTYAAACERLACLAELGVTALELLPVAAFAGERGWGYDGVALYAPFAPYGSPDELRQFVDDAHALGLAVLLDVVYNHFGPAGNYLPYYGAEYLTREFATRWGEAPNFRHREMRRYVLENARYWLTEFRFDGLRVDACHAIADDSEPGILRELAALVAQLEPRKLLIAEDERNDPACVAAPGFDAVWSDDFHHAVRVTLTGERDGYYAAYEPGAAALADTIERGWWYEGQISPLTGLPRGAPARELAAEHFVYCIQNHDQIGNRALGERLSAAVSIDAYCAVSALLLFLPMTPLLFMGQEWAASSPFLFFSDHEPELGERVSLGRREEFSSFTAFRDPAVRARIPDPQAPESFERSKLRWAERDEPAQRRVLELYRALLALRRSDPVLRAAGREQLRAQAHGDVLIARLGLGDQLRVLLLNLGEKPAPVDPLPLDGRAWVSLLSTSGAPGLPDTLGPLAFALLAGTRAE